MAAPHAQLYAGDELHATPQVVTIVVHSRKANTQDTNHLAICPSQPIRLLRAWYHCDQGLDLSGAASYMILEKDDGSTETELAKSTIGNYSADTIVDLPFKADTVIEPGEWVQVRYDQNTDQSSGTEVFWQVGVEFVYLSPR